jgi:KAP family P-loop domain
MSTPLWSDNPSPVDLLGFADVTAGIIDALQREKLDPVTVGIEGDWGSGKTSMLKLLAADLGGEDSPVVVVETHPWEYDPATDPKATLIAEVLGRLHEELDERKKLSAKVKDKFKALAKRVQVSKAVKLAVTSAATGGLPKLADVLGLFNGDAETVPDPTLQGFREEFAELMAMEELADISRVVVLVDDLDRCLPETVIATLEAVKLFLSVRKMAFVIAADRRAVSQALATNYERYPRAAELGREYLEKIVHIPERVPALGLSDARAYLALLMLQTHLDSDMELQPYIQHCDTRRAAGEADVIEGLPQEKLSGDAKADLQLAAMLAPVLYERVHGNPRRLKRFLNAYWMRATVARRRSIELEPNALAKLMVLEELEDPAFKVLLGWLREGVLAERLKAVEEGDQAPGGEAVAEALTKWASIEPKLAEVPELESYLRLAASLRSQVGIEVGLRSDVRDLIEGLLTSSQSERRGTVKALPSQPLDTRLQAVEYLIDRIESNPGDQSKVAPALGVFAQEPVVAKAMAPGLEALPPDRIEASLVAGLLPGDKASPEMRTVVSKWLESDRLEAGAASIARKALGIEDPEKS